MIRIENFVAHREKRTLGIRHLYRQLKSLGAVIDDRADGRTKYILAHRTLAEFPASTQKAAIWLKKNQSEN